MNRFARLLRKLSLDTRGTMALETAVIAPTLILFSLGSFQVSHVVARQHELTSAMAEAESIALSALPTTETKRTALASVIMTSTGLNANHVAVSAMYRCDYDTNYVDNASNCDGGDKVSSYVKIILTDTYTPMWAKFGFGSAMNLSVTRYVMVSQTS